MGALLHGLSRKVRESLTLGDTILNPGSSILFFGAGPTGIILAQLLKLNGAVHLTVAAPAGPKLDLVSQLAADEGVPIDRNDAQSHRERLLREHRHGFDYVIEATGSSQLCNEALQYARPGGHIVVYVSIRQMLASIGVPMRSSRSN